MSATREEIRLSLNAEQVRELHKILTLWIAAGNDNPELVKLLTIFGSCTVVKGALS